MSLLTYCAPPHRRISATATAPPPTPAAPRSARRGHPFPRVGPDIAGSEDAGNTALQVERIPVPIPSRRAGAIRQKIGAGVHEALFVARDGVAEPVGTRFGADEDEQVPAFHGRLEAVLTVAHRDRLQVTVALRRDD